MKSDEEILSFLDLLDIDEEIIDLRIKCILEKSNYTNRHLTNLLHLLQYKQLINVKEECECENEHEFMIVGKLLSIINDENIDLISKIIYTIIILDPSSVVSKSEHLFQQILANMYLPMIHNSNDTETENLNTTYLQLKICVCIVDAVTNCNKQLSLPFLDTQLECIAFSQHNKLNSYFLTNVVPRFFDAIEGYNILDRIWYRFKDLKEKDISLKILCSLSNYYLPMAEGVYKSNITTCSEFWDIIYYGLDTNCVKNRKYSLYLFKRALDCLIKNKNNINIKSKCVFTWKVNKIEESSKIWNNYFTLIDSLEEKQSNIVLPSLKLFNVLKTIEHCWLICALNIGLKHDNAQVRYKCINHRLDYGIDNETEAVILLEAINNTNLFDDDNDTIKKKLKMTLQSNKSFFNIIKAMPLTKWLPVTLYHITKILMEHDIKISYQNCMENSNILINLINIPCNNIVIRKAIYINISVFIAKCYDLNWREYLNIYGSFPKEIIDINTADNILTTFIKNELTVPESDTKIFLEELKSNVNIDFALIYFAGHNDSNFLVLINNTIDKIKDISERQYSKKSDCFSDTIFITEIYRRFASCIKNELLTENAPQICKTILNYVKSLLTSDEIVEGGDYFHVDDIRLLFAGLNCMVAKYNQDDNIVLQLYKSTLLHMKDEMTDINKRVLNIFILDCTLKCPTILQHQINYEEVVRILFQGLKFSKHQSNDNNNSIGRLKNTLYEKSCEVLHNILLNHFNNTDNVYDILNFMEHTIDNGGYGCLKWILKIMNKILPTILESGIKYDVPMFLNKIWREIEELKSNSQYSICIKEFVSLLTQHSMLIRTIYNNTVVLYSSKIMEYSTVKSTPLFYLIKEMNEKDISNYSHMVFIFSDILLYSPVPKKETRKSDELIENILKDSKYTICKKQDFHFTSHIRYLSLHTLSQIENVEVLNSIARCIMKKVDEIFKNKQRYHENSQVHRTVQVAIQNLLFVTLKSRSINVERIGLWCMELLGKLPHQQFVKLCLEWYIALYIYLKNMKLNESVLHRLQSKNIPITSQFLIVYFVLMRKIKNNTCGIEEYNYVMDSLLSHTMGPTYSIRLYAQYLAARINTVKTKLESSKYEYFVEVINETLKNASADKDKTYYKLLKDYFVHDFDIVEDFTPCYIYHVLPMMIESKENLDVDFFEDIITKIDENLSKGLKDSFYDEWRSCRKPFKYLNESAVCDVVKSNEDEETGTIQKKYVPWKCMSDVNVYDMKKKGKKSDLIVVASLIDRLPNLGGMARTSEVFGVKTYVVDSLRHLQDKQFQGLSVSAERWINVEEVRPGQSLKDYLTTKKSEGYTIVAAEQTSSSTSLQTFKFPKKTLLLLGHEKEGVPCDLLPLMDWCVEIPQQGLIRSLNVHVTAGIFIWEYARQNML